MPSVRHADVEIVTDFPCGKGIPFSVALFSLIKIPRSLRGSIDRGPKRRFSVASLLRNRLQKIQQVFSMRPAFCMCVSRAS